MEHTVVDYLANQKAHHRKQSFQDEFLELLNKHEIEYDPVKIWE